MDRNTDSSEQFEKSLAQKFRDRLAEALEDPDKQKIELDILNSQLQQAAMHYRSALQNSISALFNHVAPRGAGPRFDVGYDPKIREENKNIISGLIRGEFGTDITSKIVIYPRHSSYSAGDIRELEGYIELHKIAKRADVAINIRGLTAGEKEPPAIYFDVLKSYKEGESDSKYGYPDLSAPTVAEPSAAEKAAFSTGPARRFTM